MKIRSPLALAAGAVSAQPTRPASAMVLDVPDARVVVFRIEPGQVVAPHTSTSTVLLSVLTGSGIVSGAEDERAVSMGDLIEYEVGELHGMRAIDEQLVIVAIITPRPGAR